MWHDTSSALALATPKHGIPRVASVVVKATSALLKTIKVQSTLTYGGSRRARLRLEAGLEEARGRGKVSNQFNNEGLLIYACGSSAMTLQSLHIAPLYNISTAPPRPTRARPGWINFYCTISLSRYDRRPLSARLHHTLEAPRPRRELSSSFLTYMHLDHESGERRRAGFLQKKRQQKRWQNQCKRDELLQRWWLSSREW